MMELISQAWWMPGLRAIWSYPVPFCCLNVMQREVSGRYADTSGDRRGDAEPLVTPQIVRLVLLPHALHFTTPI